MKFVATRYVKGAAYSEDFKAASWHEAEEICRKKMWHLNGRLALSITCRVPLAIAMPIARLIAWLTWEREATP